MTSSKKNFDSDFTDSTEENFIEYEDSKFKFEYLGFYKP